MKLPSSIFLRATAALAASWLLAGCSGDSESTNSQDITATDVVTMDSGGEDLHSEDSASPSDISTQDTTIDAAAPDIAEPPWTFGPVDGEEALWVETLATLPTTWIAALGEARALAVADNKLWDINPTENMEIGIPEDFDLSQLVAATRTMAGTTIIQTTGAIYIVLDGALVTSPLTEGFAGDELSAMVRVAPDGNDILWFGSSSGLHRWGEGILNSLDVGELPSANPRLAYAAPDEERLWVAAGSRIYAIDRDGDGFQAWPEPTEFEALDLVADSSGGLWARSGSGLHRRHPDGAWDEAIADFTPTRIWATPEAPSLWLKSEDGEIYRWSSDQLKLSTGISSPEQCAAEPEGSLLIANETGIYRAHPGRSISFTGISSHETLSATREVGLELAFEDLIDTLTASIGDQDLVVDTDPYRFTIDVANFDDGAYTLEVHATYSDGFPDSHAELPFSIETPHASWSDDVENISETHCGQCHGQAGFVEFKLFTKDQWVANIDLIVDAVETNLMPPGPPLDNDIIEIIKLWRDLDFPE